MKPKRPWGEKRHADVTGNSVRVMCLATGDETEEIASISPRHSPGKLGEQSNAQTITPAQRAEQAKKAAAKPRNKD